VSASAQGNSTSDIDSVQGRLNVANSFRDVDAGCRIEFESEGFYYICEKQKRILVKTISIKFACEYLLPSAYKLRRALWKIIRLPFPRTRYRLFLGLRYFMTKSN